jgi:hypothetical protein
MMLCNKFKGGQINSATASELQGEIAYRVSVLTHTADCKVYRANKPDPVNNFYLLKIMVDWPIPVDTDAKFKWDLLDNLHFLFPSIDRMEWQKWTIVPPELGQCASFARLYFFYEVARDRKQV